MLSTTCSKLKPNVVERRHPYIYVRLERYLLGLPDVGRSVLCAVTNPTLQPLSPIWHTPDLFTISLHGGHFNFLPISCR
jgi:hypothetical protein